MQDVLHRSDGKSILMTTTMQGGRAVTVKKMFNNDCFFYDPNNMGIYHADQMFTVHDGVDPDRAKPAGQVHRTMRQCTPRDEVESNTDDENTDVEMTSDEEIAEGDKSHRPTSMANREYDPQAVMVEIDGKTGLIDEGVFIPTWKRFPLDDESNEDFDEWEKSHIDQNQYLMLAPDPEAHEIMKKKILKIIRVI